MSSRRVAVTVTAAIAIILAFTAVSAYFAYQRNKQIVGDQTGVAAAFHIVLCTAAAQPHPVHTQLYYQRILARIHAKPCPPRAAR